MSRRSSRASFTLSWPFIIACVIGYNVFFGEDEPADKTVIDEQVQVETSNEQLERSKNKIDEVIKRVKKEIETSVVIQEAKQELTGVVDEVKKELNLDKSQAKEVPSPSAIPEDMPPPYQHMKDAPPPVMEAEKTPEPEPDLEKLEETNDLNPEDSMKSL